MTESIQVKSKVAHDHDFRSFYYDQMNYEPVTDDFRLPLGTKMTEELLVQLIDEHMETRLPRYLYLKAAYETRYMIFSQDKKPDYKPDNRLAADMARYLTETFEGYFLGNPVKLKINAEDAQKWLESYGKRNDQEMVDSDISVDCSKYGNAFELLYQDREGEPRSAELSPLNAFMVYDTTVERRPLFGVFYSYDEEGSLQGEWCDESHKVEFYKVDSEVVFNAPRPHAFGGVPMIEYVQNKDKRGLYEGVLNLIEAYNKALSEKANEVDYFADAYLVVKGKKLEDEDLKKLREDRTINLYGEDFENLEVLFVVRPSGDQTQENLINRLEQLIFRMAMVPDITDESFATASGIALKMRLMPMSNLAKVKERRFVAAIRRRLQLLDRYPTAKAFSGNAWESVDITMQRNMPEDLASEAQLASSLSGIVSEETQLGVLSCVDDVKSEISRKEQEKESRAEALSGFGMPVKSEEKQTESDDGTGD